MTPTEQDNKLDKILDVLIDSVVEARMKWHKQSQRARQDQSSNSGFSRYQSELNDADNTAKSAIKQLITADRERVALEARIDEVERELKRYGDVFNYPPQLLMRKVELKAQQEEV